MIETLLVLILLFLAAILRMLFMIRQQMYADARSMVAFYNGLSKRFGLPSAQLKKTPNR